MIKALFIDRDGTINYDAGYSHSIADLKLYPDAIATIKKYRKQGYLIVVITNQSGIGRGYFTEAHMKKFNAEINRRLVKAGTKVDAFYWCPHTPEDHCNCRKPNTGMVKKAAKELGIDIKQSLVIGDNDETDGGLARKLKMKYIIVKRPKRHRAADCGIVLAGGKGMRLRSIDSVKPKPLVEVGGKPVVAHVIDNMIKYGIRNIIVCTGYKANMIKRYVAKRYKGKANVTFSHAGDIDTGSRVRLAVERLNPEYRAVTVAFGDDVNDIDHIEMYRFHKMNRAQITMAIQHVKNTTGFGLVKLSGNRIVRFVEKPEKPTSGFVNIGVVIFSKDELSKFPARRDFNLTKDFMEQAARKHLLLAYKSSNRWQPIDTPERYHKAKRLIK
jgi:histidinol-phosphate phosphatase family protein